MKHVTILVPGEAVLASIVDPRTMFTGVNEFLEAAGKPALFKVQLAGLSKQVKLNNGLFAINTDVLIQNLRKTDLIIIPALSGDIKNIAQAEQEIYSLDRKAI